jgi:hypothetical protein
MSRIPQSRTNTKSASTPKDPLKVATPSQAKLSVQSPSTQRVRTQSTMRATSTATPSTPRVRTQSTSSRATTPSKQRSAAETPPPVPATPLSIREAIALKRAEAKKVQPKVAVTGEAADKWTGLEDTIPDAPKPEEEDLLGRMSVRDTIERARSTGKSQEIATASC